MQYTKHFLSKRFNNSLSCHTHVRFYLHRWLIRVYIFLYTERNSLKNSLKIRGGTAEWTLSICYRVICLLWTDMLRVTLFTCDNNQYAVIKCQSTTREQPRVSLGYSATYRRVIFKTWCRAKLVKVQFKTIALVFLTHWGEKSSLKETWLQQYLELNIVCFSNK